MPISSKKRVPPWASSKRPGLEAMAPVKDPFSWPKSSASARPSGRAEALTAMKGRSPRPEATWMAGAVVVDGVRDELLAGAALPLEHDGGVRGGDFLDVGEEAPHDGCRADQLVETVLLTRLIPQLPILLDQPPALERASQDDHELLRIHGLSKEIEGAELDRAEHGLAVLFGGHHDDGRFGVAAPDVLEEVQAFFDGPGGGKTQVEKVEVGV